MKGRMLEVDKATGEQSCPTVCLPRHYPRCSTNPPSPLPPYQQMEQEIENEERIFNRMFLIFSIDSRDVLLVGSLK